MKAYWGNGGIALTHTMLSFLHARLLMWSLTNERAHSDGGNRSGQ
jgi:hypothetical protein